MQQLWPCIIRYLNSACGMPQHPLYWLNFHPAHSKEEGGAVGDVTNRQLALKIKSFSCLTRFRTCMERAGYMCEYSVRNTIQQPSSYPPPTPTPTPTPTSEPPRPPTTIEIAGETQPQSHSRHSFQCQLHVHAAFSLPSFPFPLWFPVALCLSLPLPFAPSICNCCSWVSISLLGRVISSHIASSLREPIWLVVYAFVLHCEKKKTININSIIMYEGCQIKNMNTLRNM